MGLAEYLLSFASLSMVFASIIAAFFDKDIERGLYFAILAGVLGIWALIFRPDRRVQS